MQDTKDELQIKIDKARLDLPADTRAAIDAGDWRGVIMHIRDKEGYDFIQLGELETETELLLCGLANPEEYPRRIEKGMGIRHEAAQELVNEMNEKIFKKIKEGLIKITENRKTSSASPLSEGVKSPALSREGLGEGLNDTLGKAGIQITEASPGGNGATQALETREEILEKVEKPAPVLASAEPHPLLAGKLSGPMQIPSSKTVHSLDNLTKPPLPPTATPAKTPPSAPQKYGADPYRETPE